MSKNNKHEVNVSKVELLKYHTNVNKYTKRTYLDIDKKDKIAYYMPTRDTIVIRSAKSKKNTDRINVISEVLSDIKKKKSYKGKKLVVARADYKLKKLGYEGMPYQLKKHYELV